MVSYNSTTVLTFSNVEKIRRQQSFVVFLDPLILLGINFSISKYKF